MYDFTDDQELSGEDVFGEQGPFQLDQTEREWSKMSEQFYNAGYREGITAGKEGALQKGFDDGFAEIGAPTGRHLGKLRGMAAGLSAFLKSPMHQCGEACRSANIHESLREAIGALDGIHFADIEPLDEEAVEHALEHENMNGTGSSHVKLDSGARRESLAELDRLRRLLEQYMALLGLGLTPDDPPRSLE